MKINNIILTGFMGAGKTTVGQITARKLNWTFVDTDSLIETEINCSIREFFCVHGEGIFRDIESRILEKVLQEKNQVISTGGGIILRETNRNMMKLHGIVVWLKASPEVIFGRVKNDMSRPVLGEQPDLERIKEILSKRLPLYAEADFILETDNLSPETISTHLTQIYSQYKAISQHFS
jgi:shikimate kinase